MSTHKTPLMTPADEWDALTLTEATDPGLLRMYGATVGNSADHDSGYWVDLKFPTTHALCGWVNAVQAEARWLVDIEGKIENLCAPVMVVVNDLGPIHTGEHPQHINCVRSFVRNVPAGHVMQCETHGVSWILQSSPYTRGE